MRNRPLNFGFGNLPLSKLYRISALGTCLSAYEYHADTQACSPASRRWHRHCTLGETELRCHGTTWEAKCEEVCAVTELQVKYFSKFLLCILTHRRRVFGCMIPLSHSNHVAMAKMLNGLTVNLRSCTHYCDPGSE